jgi:hypothetical protein
VSDELVIAGGGVITVAGEDLLVAVDRARAVSVDVQDVALVLLSDVADPVLRAIAHDAEELADRLRSTSVLLALAVDGYSAAESAVGSATGFAVSQGAYWTGVIAPVALALVPAPLALGVAAWLAGGAPGGRAVLDRHRFLLTEPRVVAALRLAAGSVDDAVRGAAGLPWPASLAADDRVTGLLGREAVARLVLGGLPGPTPGGPVRLTAHPTRAVAAPESLDDLASRIPPPRDGGPQLAVERYEGTEGPVYALYLGGTVDFEGTAGSEPWDLASNVAAMADAPASSVHAAAAALRASGASPEDRVVLVGYSQGGLIASRLAESGDFRVAGMVTVGSPGGAIPAPEGVPVLAVEHTEDLVPATRP